MLPLLRRPMAAHVHVALSASTSASAYDVCVHVLPSYVPCTLHSLFPWLFPRPSVTLLALSKASSVHLSGRVAGIGGVGVSGIICSGIGGSPLVGALGLRLPRKTTLRLLTLV